MIQFQNYHRHSEYTNVRIPDSVTTIREYAMRAKSLGHTILSSCEHGWQGNYYETIKIAKEFGLKPLVSAEAYWVKDRFEKDRSNCHIFIAAMNENGRKALNDVLSEANVTGFYGQPRLDIPLILSLPKDDVIVTTACIAYWKYDDIEQITKQFADHFGKHFFLEVQYHNTDSQRSLNQYILDLHRRYNIPIIMGCDSHYIGPNDAQTREDFLSSKGFHYESEEGWFLDYPDGDTAYQRFAEQCVLTHEEILEAINNTNIFLRVEDYDSPIFDTTIKMPSLLPGASQEEKNKKYESLVWGGWENYKLAVDKEKWPFYEEEIRKEIQIVEDTKMADYFINNYYIIRKGKENGGWLTKSGRGSAVSFFTNMLLGFTEVDRIAAKVHMYPERFMSTTRILQSGSLPDIDFNCAPVEPFARAQKEILGDDHSYPMIAYGTMQKSAAWKLYAKSQGIGFELANAVSAQIRKYEVALKKTSEEERHLIHVIDFIEDEFKEVYSKSSDYLGITISWSIAPCSYLLYAGSIRKEIGLVKVKENLCCIMDGHWAEECHFLKNDLLKVSVVDLIYRAYHRIGMEPPSVKELLEMCPPDDAAWDVYKKGCTIGINQCEQTGTAARAMKYKPKNISELSAFVAAIRPGFRSMYKTFENRQPFSYGVKAFDDLIQTEEMPDSFILYQEQEMAALNYAGIDMSDCYTAIKNIAKKRTDKVLAYKDKFIPGFRKEIIEHEGRSLEEAEKIADELWKIIEDSARYSFNASHSYCVALDSLYCAWLKAHHPLEFYETLLKISEEKSDKDKILALHEEAKKYFGIKFSHFKYGEDNRETRVIPGTGTITTSITAIKGFSQKVGTVLWECSQQSHTYFYEVIDYLFHHGVRESKITPLICIDYFSAFGNIPTLMAILEAYIECKGGNAKYIRSSQIKDDVFASILAEKCTYITKHKEITTFRADGLFHLYMRAYEEYLCFHPKFDIATKTKIEYYREILGYLDIATGKPADRKRLIILSVSPLVNGTSMKPWGYRLATKSIGTGKEARITVRAEQYDSCPLVSGDIIKNLDVWKNPAGYWYLFSYVREGEFER